MATKPFSGPVEDSVAKASTAARALARHNLVTLALEPMAAVITPPGTLMRALNPWKIGKTASILSRMRE